MAIVKVFGDELVLELSFWERIGAIHSSPRVALKDVTKVEFVDDLWSNEVLRGVRAPGTAIPYVVLLGTMRGRNYSDFTAIKGRGLGAVIHFLEGPFERWIITLRQPRSEIESLLT